MMNFKRIKYGRGKISISIAITLFCFHSLCAQNEPETESTTYPIAIENKTKLAIKIGYIHSTHYGKDLDFLSSNGESYPLSGYQIGLAVNSLISISFWFKHELNFQQSGSKVMLGGFSNSYKSPLKMHALQLLPISPTWHIKGFQVYAGPYVSMLTAASILRKDNQGNDFKDKSLFGNGKEEGETQKYLQKFDFGLAIGMEYEFNFGLNFGVRYARGLVPIFDKANANTFAEEKTNIEIYNQSWSFSLGYIL